MPKSEASVEELFQQWRGGDGAAGQAMAQRFTDWYYAVSASRLGDTQGRTPLQQACASFARGIGTVTRSAHLIDWAHEIIQRELDGGGGRIRGGDFPNALTSHRSPTSLLAEVRPNLDAVHVGMLHAAYSPDTSMADLTSLAEQHGGWPQAVLEARYALKRSLRDHCRVGFAVTPDAPVLDLAPLPLYEAARLASREEDSAFEKWLISDLDLCRDVAEFATFSHALRDGAFRPPVIEEAAPPQAAEAPAAAPEPAASSVDEYEEPRSGPPAVAIGIAVVTVLLALLAIIVVLFFFLDPQMDPLR